MHKWCSGVDLGQGITRNLPVGVTQVLKPVYTRLLISAMIYNFARNTWVEVCIEMIYI